MTRTQRPSAQRNSTASPCSCHTSAKAGDSFSVRALPPSASRRAHLPPLAHSAEARLSPPRRHRAPPRTHTAGAWRCGISSCHHVPYPSTRGIPGRGADASLPAVWRPWRSSAAARSPYGLGCRGRGGGSEGEGEAQKAERRSAWITEEGEEGENGSVIVASISLINPCKSLFTYTQ